MVYQSITIKISVYLCLTFVNYSYNLKGSFTSEIATAAFSLFSMELCDRGVLPSNDMSFNVEMPAAGSDNPCLAVEEVWRTSTTLPYCVTWLIFSALDS